MNMKRHTFAAAIASAAILAGIVGYWIAQRDTATPPQDTAPAERQVLYWYDPMVPDQHFDKPGKSPFMDMELLPKYAEEGAEAAAVRIDATLAQNLGVRLTKVERGVLAQPIEAVGTIGFNQRTVAVVQARSAGFVARVYALAPGDVVQRGAPLVDLVVPAWAAAQTEFIALLNSGDRELIDAARERLLLLGMPADLVQRVATSRTPETATTIRAPIAGAIASLDVREGMAVDTGAALATINGLDTVWVDAAVPESAGGLPSLGKAVEVRLAAYPDKTFDGKVIAVLPEANIETRTVRVRIELENRDALLRPGMFAQVRLDAGTSQPQLYVDSEAVIRTGTRNVVIVSDGQGHFTPTSVQVGAEANGKTTILAGLTAGQQVVSSGQFLIDSEASLRGVLARMPAGAVDGPEDSP